MYFDIACVIVLAILGLIGFLKGFLSQLISVAAIVAGLLGTMYLVFPVGDWVVSWLCPRAPELQPALVRIGVFVVLLFTIYILTGAVLEAVKKKLMHSFALQLNDRLLGMATGLAKGLVLVLAVVLVLDNMKGLVQRVASTKGYERYQAALDSSDVFSCGRYLIGVSRDQSLSASSVLARIETILPPGSGSNVPGPAVAATTAALTTVVQALAPTPVGAPERKLVPAPDLVPAPTGAVEQTLVPAPVSVLDMEPGLEVTPEPERELVPAPVREEGR